MRISEIAIRIIRQECNYGKVFYFYESDFVPFNLNYITANRFNVLNLDESKLLGIIGHVIIILIGIALIYLHAKYNKDRSNN